MANFLIIIDELATLSRRDINSLCALFSKEKLCISNPSYQDVFHVKHLKKQNRLFFVSNNAKI